MRFLALMLLLGSTAALAQQVPTRQINPRAPIEIPAYAQPKVPIAPRQVAAPALMPPPPETPPFKGELSPFEVDLIARALARMQTEVDDPDTRKKAAFIKSRLMVAKPAEVVSDRTLAATVGLALSMATNVEVDRMDEHGVMVIDNAASRAASKPYCDLLKKINPQGGCTRW